MSNICHILKDTRLNKGLTLEEVAQRTYIKLHYLEALEEGYLDRLPAPVHTYGYIRQYAKLLGLDGGAMVAEFQAYEKSQSSPGPSGHSGPLRQAQPEPAAESYSPFKGMLGGNGNGRSNGNGRNGHDAVHTANGHANGNGHGTHVYLAAEGESADLRQAKLQAQQILTSAEREAQQMVRGAEVYADDVLAQLESEVAKTLQIIHNGRQFLQARRQPGSLGH